MIKLKNLFEGTRYEQFIDLFESPQKIAAWSPTELHDMGKNSIILQKIKPDSKFDEFKDYIIYSYSTNDLKISMVTRDDNYILAYFEYYIKNNIFYTKRVWQDPICIGLCREILLEYFLQKFNGVTSGEYQTELGQQFWEKLVETSLNKNYKIYVLNKQNVKIKQIVNVEELKNYYDESYIYSDFTFLIEK